jgi:uncharacterized protein
MLHNFEYTQMKKSIPALLILFTVIACIVCPFLTMLPCPAYAQTTFPEPQGYVSDFAGILSAGSIQRLQQAITYIQQKTGAEVAVVTIESIDPYTIEEYAVRLFENWKIGEKGKDNGALILIALKERKIRIEVGYGLEGAITDGQAGEIIRESITPAFKKGDFDSGLVEGTGDVLRLIAKEYNVELPGELGIAPGGKPQTAPKGIKIFSFLLFLFFIFLVLRGRLWPLLFLGFPGGGGGWSGGGGGFGGGFGGFGGGMSGGGGASGGW